MSTAQEPAEVSNCLTHAATLKPRTGALACRFSLILQRFPVLANRNRPAMCKVMAVPVIGLGVVAQRPVRTQ